MTADSGEPSDAMAKMVGGRSRDARARETGRQASYPPTTRKRRRDAPRYCPLIWNVVAALPPTAETTVAL